mgnify:CR=1 FL=1
MKKALLNSRSALALAHDVVAAAVAWYGAYLLRFNFELPPEHHAVMLQTLWLVLPLQAVAFISFGLYRGTVQQDPRLAFGRRWVDRAGVGGGLSEIGGRGPRGEDGGDFVTAAGHWPWRGGGPGRGLPLSSSRARPCGPWHNLPLYPGFLDFLTELRVALSIPMRGAFGLCMLLI